MGSNQEGQLGIGDKISQSRPSPTLIEDLMGIPAEKMVCGNRFSACLTEDGDVFTWGSNAYGQLGHSDYTPYSYSPI